jgi:trehalose 6-phosphate synthase
MSRLVCVSNRLTVPKKGAGAGGLAVGVLAAMQARGGLWFGWSGELVDDEPGEPTVTLREGVAYATVDLARADHDLYYVGFANGVLWPTFHYFLNDLRYAEREYLAYERVNAQFARRLVPLLAPDDVVWVHDYHLIPLGQRLREAGVDRPIGFFLHIPFPTIEVLRALPVHAELIRDLVAYDLVGFQTDADLAAFRSAIEHLYGADAWRDGVVRVGGRTMRAGTFPIGVDVDALQASAVESQSGEAVRRMVASLAGRKLLIGVDRLDYSKGLVERFQAYEQLLETHAENRGRVTLLQVAPLSRTDVQAYARIRRHLEQSSGRTNGRFGEPDWTPIRYLNRNIPQAVLTGFYRAAHVGLVTPVRDGMNLVAKEFVAAQDAADPGVLVLSTLAGAAREMTSAVLVNPYDAKALAHAMQAAVNMPLTERRERHAALLDVLRRNDIHAWHRRFLGALEQAPAESAGGGD